MRLKKIVSSFLAVLLLTGIYGCGEEETNENGDKLLYECKTEPANYDNSDGEKVGEYSLSYKIYGTSKDEPIQQIVADRIITFDESDRKENIDEEAYTFGRSCGSSESCPPNLKVRTEGEDDETLIEELVYFPEDTDALYRSFGVRPHAPASKVAEAIVNSLSSKLVCNPPVK